MRAQIISQIVKIFTLGGMSTVLSFMLAPLVLKFLLKKKCYKQIRQDQNAPIYIQMHASKHEGKGITPTMGGIIF
jgi:UDP-N-acetylmuramyl pentapeptide phosphotransferase/UDP-N-acetylglucosamine-1-phosphate transferase